MTGETPSTSRHRLPRAWRSLDDDTNEEADEQDKIASKVQHRRPSSGMTRFGGRRDQDMDVGVVEAMYLLSISS